MFVGGTLSLVSRSPRSLCQAVVSVLVRFVAERGCGVAGEFSFWRVCVCVCLGHHESGQGYNAEFVTFELPIHVSAGVFGCSGRDCRKVSPRR